VFDNTFFATPAAVRARTPYFPGFARYSRQHYGGGRRGDVADWHGRPVRLDGNSRAQMAWQRYAGRALSRGSGFGLRHIWGHPWDPTAFTAGWNLAYMPHWAGMLTETQHADPQIQMAVRQASWDLFFKKEPVCTPPEFVSDPGLDLKELLEGQPLLLLAPSAGPQRIETRQTRASTSGGSVDDVVRQVRAQTHQSWSNIRKAIASLRNLPHERFGTANVEASAKSTVRRMCRETGLELGALHDLVERIADR
jgi:hypothetical protein